MDPQQIYLTLALLTCGCAAGFSAGLLGIGGGAVMVPVLYYVLAVFGYPESVTMHMAVATSSAVIIPGSLRSVRAHHAHGAVDWDFLWPRGKPHKSWGLWIGAGSLLAASVLARYIPGQALTLIFGVMASLVSLQFIFGRPGFRFRDRIPGGLALPVVGGTVGMLSALMGIGGGAMSVTLLTLCNKSIHRAIGTASGIGVFISIPATLGFMTSGWGVADRPPLSLGYISVLGWFLLTVTALIFIPLGAKTAHNTDAENLRRTFGIFLLVIALNLTRTALGG